MKSSFTDLFFGSIRVFYFVIVKNQKANQWFGFFLGRSDLIVSFRSILLTNVMNNVFCLQMGRPSRSPEGHTRRSGLMLNWSLWENMDCGTSVSFGESSMLWAGSGMLQGSCWPLMKRIPVGFLKARLCFAGWTAMAFLMRLNPSWIMFLPLLLRTFLRGGSRLWYSNLEWPSQSITPGCLSDSATSGIFLAFLLNSFNYFFAYYYTYGCALCSLIMWLWGGC